MTLSEPLLVGRLPFLVCAPFFHSTLGGLEGFRFLDGVPSYLNAELQAGRIDCAPSSSFEYALHFQDYQLFPGISTSSRMEMKSVLFLSQVRWEDLDSCPIGLSSDSATSNVLFQILCSRYYKVSPKIDSTSEEPLGRVFIGDRALQESVSGHWKYRYDLADVWSKWHGLPFSFGLWIVRREASAQKAQLVKVFQQVLESSLAAFRADTVRALTAWTSFYPSALPQSLILEFYQTADYGFSPEHAQSLEIFYRLAHAEGYLPSLPKLHFV